MEKYWDEMYHDFYWKHSHVYLYNVYQPFDFRNPVYFLSLYRCPCTGSEVLYHSFNSFLKQEFHWKQMRPLSIFAQLWRELKTKAKELLRCWLALCPEFKLWPLKSKKLLFEQGVHSKHVYLSNLFNSDY